MTEIQIREAFEKWYLSNDLKPRVLTKNRAGVYIDIDIERMFMTWQAAQAEAQQKLSALETDCIRLKTAWDSSFNQAMENGQKYQEAQQRIDELEAQIDSGGIYVRKNFSYV